MNRGTARTLPGTMRTHSVFSFDAKAFVALSTGHVVLEETDTAAVPYILPWLTKMATDDPTWSNEMR